MDDASLIEAFESCSLAETEFRHREHVRIAWLYVTAERSFEAAAHRFCVSLRRYAQSLGKGDRYHETITWAFLTLVNARQHVAGAVAFESFAEKNADLFEPDLAALHRFYDRETLHSELARRVFVLPRSTLAP